MGKYSEFRKLYKKNKIPLVTNIFLKRFENALEFCSLDEESIILDIGCNRGDFLKLVRITNPSCKCYGLDKKIIEEVEGCDIRIADGMNLPFSDNFFDKVVTLDVLEHIEDFIQVIKEIKRVLKPNGIVVISGPTESKFYKFCRFLWLHEITPGVMHYFTVYDNERGFTESGFKLISRKTLPGFPFPSLFRINKYKNIK